MPDMYFNITENISGMVPLFQEANNVSAGIFGISIPIMLFVILFAAFVNHGKKTAFSSASFITMVVSVLLMTLDIVDTFFVFTMITITAVSVMVLYFTGGDN